MTQSTNRNTQSIGEDTVIPERVRPQSEIQKNNASKMSVIASDRHRSVKGRAFVYPSGTLWSNLKYGLGTMSVLVIPPFIPGVSSRGLIMGYMGAVVAIFAIVCIWGMIRSLRSPEPTRGVHRSKKFT
jgi:hypothetical protein